MGLLSGSKIIYVCHSFGDDPVVNTELIRARCRLIANEELVPLAPQLLLPQFIDEESERDLAISCCLRLVAAADELWVYGELTEGMRLEIARAQQCGIRVVQKDLR